MIPKNPASKKPIPENNPYRKFMRGPKTSRAGAIKAMCAYCMGCTLEEINPGFRSDIRNCTSTYCPLHSMRPYQEKP